MYCKVVFLAVQLAIRGGRWDEEEFIAWHFFSTYPGIESHCALILMFSHALHTLIHSYRMPPLFMPDEDKGIRFLCYTLSTLREVVLRYS